MLGVCVCMCVCTQSCLTLCNLMDCSLPGSSVHGIFEARILEWVAIFFSRGSSQPRDRTHVPCGSCTAIGVLSGLTLLVVSQASRKRWGYQQVYLTCWRFIIRMKCHGIVPEMRGGLSDTERSNVCPRGENQEGIQRFLPQVLLSREQCGGSVYSSDSPENKIVWLKRVSNKFPCPRCSFQNENFNPLGAFSL